MKRIIFIKTLDPDILTSKKPLVSKNGISYYVLLNTKELTYKIIYTKKQTTLRTGGENVSNMNVLKRNIKKDLVELGVEFEDEIRDRNFGVCEKGYNQDKHEGN